MLNRLTFGPRPGDVDRVMAIGVDKWIDQQLHPDKIDDSALDARLSPFRTLRMDTREIVENFPSEQMIKAIANGKQSLPSDPLKRAIYQAQLERYQDKEERKQQTAVAGPDKMADDERFRRQQERIERRSKDRGPARHAAGPAHESAPQDVAGRAARRYQLPARRQTRRVYRRNESAATRNHRGAQQSAAGRQQRTGRRQAAARDLQRPPVAGSDDRFLVQSLQRVHRQGRRSLPADQLRARRHSSACPGQI